MRQFRDEITEGAFFDEAVLQELALQNLWNIWVPREFGGLEYGFSEGLEKLQSLARMDGSLGWTVTLCSGANYFIGNLEPETAKEIFAKPAILGGSGGMFGTAEKVGKQYKLNGIWKYATGAPYLTHFTLNAKIVEDGVEQTNEDGTPKFLSFVIPASEVTVIEDWDTMGLKASATHSFLVKDVLIDDRFSFVYNRFYLEQPIFKIHFSVFADLTLWVNYIGMAEHLLQEVKNTSLTEIQLLRKVIQTANATVKAYAGNIEELTANSISIAPPLIPEIHEAASHSVRQISAAIISIFPHLGINASRENHIINRIFRDYFTATQHHIFTK
jgi:alkylation response protein AidB-like acyl-CoA dehydrogenase